VSGLPGSIRGGLDWNRAFVLSGDKPSRVAYGSVRWIAFIFGDEKRASPDSQI